MPYDPYGLFAYMGGPDGTNWRKVRKDIDIQYPSRTLMFVEGSYVREHTYWHPSIDTGLPVDPYHAGGTEVNILACDGSAFRFSDFELTKPPHDIMGKWCLPEYWYRIDQ